MKPTKPLINKWSHLKGSLKQRPLLAYRLGLSIEELQKYYNSIPSDEEILRIENLIFKDRVYKTHGIREELRKVVGYREAAIFAFKIGISDTKLRDIIEGKDLSPSYEIIDKIEIYLNAITGYNTSVENSESETFLSKELNKLSDQVVFLGLDLIGTKRDILDLNKKKDLYYNGIGYKTNGQMKIQHLRSIKDRIESIISELENLTEIFIDNPDKK